MRFIKPLITTICLGSVLAAVFATSASARMRGGLITLPTASGSADSIPGIPNRPDLVTVVPFFTKPNETLVEQTKVPIMAEVDGHRGLFILDVGTNPLQLNRTFLRPRATGGVDTVLETDTADTHHLATWRGTDPAHVTMRIGTLVTDPVLATAPQPNPRHLNAALNHIFGNYSWVFAPRLGNIGLSVLEPFETIIDYPRRRVVLIRLDTAGHRLVDVPAYTPAWSTPIIDAYPDRHHWGVEARLGGVLDSLFFDTGDENNELSRGTAKRAQAGGHLTHKVLDSLVIAGRVFTQLPIANTAPVNVLGFPFLSPLGAIGFNHRTHQFLVYR